MHRRQLGRRIHTQLFGQERPALLVDSQRFSAVTELCVQSYQSLVTALAIRLQLDHLGGVGKRQGKFAVPGERVDQAVKRPYPLGMKELPPTLDPRLVVAFEKRPAEDSRGDDRITISGAEPPCAHSALAPVQTVPGNL